MLYGHEAPPFAPAEAADRALSQQARAGVMALPSWLFEGVEDRERLVAALLFEARMAGLTRIDAVVPGASGTGVFAIQGRHGDPEHRSVYVDRAEALARTVGEHRERLRAEEEAARRRAAEPAAMAEPDGPTALDRLRPLLP